MIDGKANSLWLTNVQRFEVLSEGCLHLSGVFLIRLRHEGVIIRGTREEFLCQRKTLNANDLFAHSIDNAREVERVGVVVQ